MNSGSPEQLPQCFLNLNWDHVRGAASHPQAALGSIMSSSTSSSAATTSAESLAFHKFVGGLHGVANSAELIFPQPHFVGALLNSPLKLNLSMMGGLYHHPQTIGGLLMPGHQVLPAYLDHFLDDPGFAESAARLSSLDGRNYGQLRGKVAAQESGRLSRAQSSKSLTESGRQIGLLPGVNNEMNDREVMNAREKSSVSDPIVGEAFMGAPPGGNGKKRKAPSKGKGKDTSFANSAGDPPESIEEDNSRGKRSRTEGDGPQNGSAKLKAKQTHGASTSGNDGSPKQGTNNKKAPEPPKDYIHVRARRGQATDSHSLAERVRREKISQRMKLLQDLVPGCNEVTGKAVMLNEIINYVQSLQRQVEFLSMKLATVNPHLDFNNLANLLPKDQTCESMPNSVYSLEESRTHSSFANHPQLGNSLSCGLSNAADSKNSLNLLESCFHQGLGSHQSFLNGLENPSEWKLKFQLGNFWEDDLQGVVQMDIGQGQEMVASSHSFHGPPANRSHEN